MAGEMGPLQRGPRGGTYATINGAKVYMTQQEYNARLEAERGASAKTAEGRERMATGGTHAERLAAIERMSPEEARAGLSDKPLSQMTREEYAESQARTARAFEPPARASSGVPTAADRYYAAQGRSGHMESVYERNLRVAVQRGLMTSEAAAESIRRRRR